jgi:dipeptidyl aminopeptidase/acylaminoacyl peptidase
MLTTATHGSWSSPITAALIAGQALGLSRPRLVGGRAHWLELRPAEGGRLALVCDDPGGQRELAPGLDVRTRVHEYGGGAYCLAADGTAYASNFADQRLYRIDGAGTAPITPAAPLRYADGEIDARRGRWFGVVERHGDGEPENFVGAVDLATGALTELATGHDFCACPRLSPDGRRLAWIAWRHPNMPWDGTELWLASIGEDGRLASARCVAGGGDESIVQPTWSPAGELYLASDRTGFWNLYRLDGEALTPVLVRQAELAGPLWTFDSAWFGVRGDGSLVCTVAEAGHAALVTLDPATGATTPIPLPYTDLRHLCVEGDRAVVWAGAPAGPNAVLELDLATGAYRVLQQSFELALDRALVSEPRAIEFPTTDGATSHALYYPPKNPAFVAPKGELPPLLVISHGGPTAQTSSALRLDIQFWTSRGFAVVDVDYRGSTGYGRAYRNALRGNWGVADVDDCAHAALYLAREGLVDADRLAIRGGSAGGYTTLCALAFRDIFHAGASHFGVSDLAALAEHTHKFESRYLDRLIGPYPERADLYRARSPIHHADQIRCPVIFLQGLEDAVVPPSQSEAMADALARAGVPVSHLAFEGEQHGFRRADSIERALAAELSFYAAVFGFDTPDAIELEIRNRDALPR